MNKKLNKSVLITGGSQGLGLVIASKFIKKGFDVIIVARKKDSLNKAF